MRKKISQRSAVKLKKRVKELENQLWSLRHGYIGARLGTWSFSEVLHAQVKTAKTLEYITLISPTGSGTDLEIRAVKL
jgi:hypothetical protein